mgnify:CR=1 FL=1
MLLLALLPRLPLPPALLPSFLAGLSSVSAATHTAFTLAALVLGLKQGLRGAAPLLPPAVAAAVSSGSGSGSGSGIGSGNGSGSGRSSGSGRGAHSDANASYGGGKASTTNQSQRAQMQAQTQARLQQSGPQSLVGAQTAKQSAPLTIAVAVPAVWLVLYGLEALMVVNQSQVALVGAAATAAIVSTSSLLLSRAAL